ncbi:MAG: outer membrane lipoprotein-sorting protein [Thermoanaerobaculia bacterium]
MRKTYILAAALLFALAAQGADLTVDEILAKNAEAKGGIEKLRALKSVRFTGKLSLGGGLEAPLTLVKSRPENMRLDFTLQGLTGTQAYDGTNGWMVMPFLGKKDAEAMSAEMLKDAREQADFDGPFIDSEKKGYKIELLGDAEVSGTKAYKLKLTREGNETLFYIDATSFLDIKTESKRKMQGQEVEAETTMGNYREFEGLLFPTSIEMKAKGAPAGQTITIEKVELNPAIETDLFTMPKKAEAAPATKQ